VRRCAKSRVVDLRRGIYDPLSSSFCLSVERLLMKGFWPSRIPIDDVSGLNGIVVVDVGCFKLYLCSAYVGVAITVH
jgi:hypothetical protein